MALKPAPKNCRHGIFAIEFFVLALDIRAGTKELVFLLLRAGASNIDWLHNTGISIMNGLT